MAKARTTKAPARRARTRRYQRAGVVRRGLAWIIAGSGALLLLVILGKAVLKPPAEPIDVPAESQLAVVQDRVTHVSPDVFEAVGTGGLANPFKTVTYGQTLGVTAGRAPLLYLSAEYCPNCAAERWSLIVALSRFGEFGTLRPMRSMSGELNPNLPTFTCYRSEYASSFVNLVAVESATRDKQPLQQITQEQQSLLKLYDPASTLPFVEVGNRYYAVGSGFDASILRDKSWDQISGALSDAADPTTNAIVGNANYITAAICQVTGGEPASVCSSTAVSAAASKLPK